MRLLVVGGTRFLGRALVAAAVARGHEVTVLHRGRTCAGAPGVQHLHADRDADLSVLGTHEWDATIDTCAYWPRQVEILASALGGRGGRHLLISTVSVYDELPHPGCDEDAPLQAPLGLDGSRPGITWQTLIDALVGTLSPSGTTLTWVPSEWLIRQDVSARDLPLWSGSDDPEPVLALDPGRAIAAGLVPRPLADTITDTAAWLADPTIADPPTRLGLTEAREARLLEQWAADRAAG